MATMAEVRRIAWSIYWKWFLVASIGGFIFSFVAGGVVGGVSVMVSGRGAYATPPWQIAAMIAGGIAGIVASFLAFNYLIANSVGKQIGSKKIILVDAFAAGEK